MNAGRPGWLGVQGSRWWLPALFDLCSQPIKFGVGTQGPLSFGRGGGTARPLNASKETGGERRTRGEALARVRAVANGRAMRERNPHTHWWGGWLGTTGMRDWRGVFQKILREVVWALESPCRSGRKVAFKASMGGRHLFEKMARRDDSQASTWPSWIEALCFPFGERSAKMG